MHLRTMNSTAGMCVRRQLTEAAHTRPGSQANDQQQQNDAEFPEAPHLKKDIPCTAADKEWARGFRGTPRCCRAVQFRTMFVFDDIIKKLDHLL